jgi:hypothetical protein
MSGHNYQETVKKIRICRESDGGWCVLEGDDPEYLCDFEGNTSFCCYDDAVNALIFNLKNEVKA